MDLKEMMENAKTPEELAEVVQNYAKTKEQEILNEARRLSEASVDEKIMISRGLRALTSEEKKFYENMAIAMKSKSPMQKLTDLDVVMPKTVVTSVFEDLTSEHPLLSMVDFQSTDIVIEFIYNADGVKLAEWGELTDKFKKELTSGFKKLDIGFAKLSAFIPVSKAMLDLGPEWLDRYVRTILSESIAEGIEDGIINGNGKTAPIGMIKDLEKPVDPSNGYKDKEAVKFEEFTPEAYAPILKTLCKSPRADGRSRVVNKVFFLVNPVDYATKVFPATTLQRIDGGYNRDVFPFPTEIIQSPHIAEGKAVMGIPGKYFFGLGTSKSGKVEFSDDVRFLDDERIYATKLYGNGKPKDNNSFVVLNIAKINKVFPEITMNSKVAA